MNDIKVTLCLGFKMSLVNNLSYENKFALYENEHAGETHFHMNGSTPRLFLTQNQKTIRNGLSSSNRLPTIIYQNIFSPYRFYTFSDMLVMRIKTSITV